MSFKRIGDVFTGIGTKKGRYHLVSLRLKEAEAMSRWEDAVGPLISKYAKAVRVRESTLIVEVEHPIWGSELHHRKHQILEKLNQCQIEKGDEESTQSIPILDLAIVPPSN